MSRSNCELVLCESPDGWSLHAPGSSDEDIASGNAPYLVSGTGQPTEADYAAARARLRAINGAEAQRDEPEHGTGFCPFCPDNMHGAGYICEDREPRIYGYTFSEWLAAAGRTDSASEYDLRAAWRAGESPSEYARGK